MLVLLSQLAPQTPWWMTQFRSYSLQHAIVIAAVVGVVLGAVLLAKRWKHTAPKHERTMRWLWALAVILLQTWSIVFWMLPVRYSLGISLPLHICDLIVWVVPVALLTDFRWAKSLVYFVGIGLTFLAFVTPVLTEGVATWHFWLFWLGHTQIIGSAVYLCAVMGYIPTRHDLIRTMLICLAYAAIVLPFNILLNVSYGYIGNLETPAIVAKVGPWPWRLIPMITLAFSSFAILWLPWAFLARRSATKQLAKSPTINIPTRDDHPDA